MMVATFLPQFHRSKHEGLPGAKTLSLAKDQCILVRLFQGANKASSAYWTPSTNLFYDRCGRVSSLARKLRKSSTQRRQANWIVSVKVSRG